VNTIDTSPSRIDAAFRDDEAFALERDSRDPLRAFRDRFHLPTRDNGQPLIYFTGNSLGLMPAEARGMVERELDDWARLAVDAHFRPEAPWYSYHETVREPLARLVGAQPGEVVAMNSLTVNLHLMMTTFYRPTEHRFRILMEAPAFPSDTYAVQTHLRARGIDPRKALLVVGPREGEEMIRPGDIEAMIAEHGRTIALVLLGGVNFFTGQCFDMSRITEAAHRAGCVIGFDLAHAAGNVPLALHDWDVDFACWCSYKYLNAGPGAVAGCFIHDRHASNPTLPRLGGWWGNDPGTRFRMHLEPEFIARPDADGWQISNPPIMALAPLRASLAIFDEATMPALRSKSLQLTGYLHWLIERKLTGASRAHEIITPREDAAHGCQLSVLVHDQPRARRDALQDAGVICDFREPNIIRAAPVPLYNTFHEVWQFARILGGCA